MAGETQVLIVGAGPVGLFLAHQLGRAGIDTLQIEAATALSDEPRAVGLDAESLRSFQSLDLLDALRPDILFGVSGDYRNGAGELLFEIRNDEPGPLGYENLSSFNQPALVRTLAAELSRYDCVRLAFEHRLLGFTQDDGGVSATVGLPDGSETTVRARYLVGCDGGRSAVRGQLGIAMQGESNPQPWLVIDTRERYPDGEKTFRFYCDPARPGMFLKTPHDNRRWEWMLLPGEDREQFLEDETIHALIAPYVDVADIDIYRRRVYDFHAIIAERFQEGRVFLAGDAAHMTPPFAGQGLNSGIRDVVNLGWKLAAVTGGQAPAALLDSYQPERYAHARELIDMALMLGQQIQPTDPEQAAARDAAFAELNAGPEEGRRGFVDGILRSMYDRYFEEGAAVDLGSDPVAGRMFPQPQVVDGEGGTRLLDEHLGAGFALLGNGCDPRQVLPEPLLEPWLAIGTRLVALDGELALGAHGDVLEALLAQGQGKLFLLRPDRFCMASFTPDTAADKLGRAAAMLGLPAA